MSIADSSATHTTEKTTNDNENMQTSELISSGKTYSSTSRIDTTATINDIDHAGTKTKAPLSEDASMTDSMSSKSETESTTHLPKKLTATNGVFAATTTNALSSSKTTSSIIEVPTTSPVQQTYANTESTNSVRVGITLKDTTFKTSMEHLPSVTATSLPSDKETIPSLTSASNKMYSEDETNTVLSATHTNTADASVQTSQNYVDVETTTYNASTIRSTSVDYASADTASITGTTTVVVTRTKENSKGSIESTVLNRNDLTTIGSSSNDMSEDSKSTGSANTKIETITSTTTIRSDYVSSDAGTLLKYL